MVKITISLENVNGRTFDTENWMLVVSPVGNTQVLLEKKKFKFLLLNVEKEAKTPRQQVINILTRLQQ